MATVTLSDQLVERLQAIADAEQRSIEEVLERFLAVYAWPPQPETDPAAPPAGTMARLVYDAERSGFHSGDPDWVDRSREILNTEFVDYLRRRMQDGDDLSD